MKIVIIELLIDGKKSGYSPVIEIFGEKPKMFTENDKPLKFKTKKEARIFGLEQMEKL